MYSNHFTTHMLSLSLSVFINTHTHILIYIYIYILGAYDKFPDFFVWAFKIVVDF